MTAVLAGQKILADHNNDLDSDVNQPTLSSIQNTAGTTTSVSFTAALSGGTACSLVFTAPPSGKVMIFHNCEVTQNTAAHFAIATFRVRTGNVIGSGTDVIDASNDNEAIFAASTTSVRFGSSRLLTGLTPGSSYNVQELFRVTAGTGTFQKKSLIVQPVQ